MTHSYQITGMTCGGCEAAVKSALLKLPSVTAAEVSNKSQSAVITMSKHIALQEFQQALGKKYSISDSNEQPATPPGKGIGTYKPVLLIFAYTNVVAIIAANSAKGFSFMVFMQTFMAGFFLAFSFFKMLNLKAFADSYAMYDIIAKRFSAWGYAYAFIELALGLAYAAGFHPLATNIITFAVMGISLVGVLQAVLNKRQIQCACLGAVFNLPMSSITIIEDALMMAMSALMIFIARD